jgi:hypothetical protein
MPVAIPPAILVIRPDDPAPPPARSLREGIECVKALREAILSRGYAIGPANSVAELIEAIKTMRPPEPLNVPEIVQLSDGRGDPDEDDFEDDADDAEQSGGITIGGGYSDDGVWLAAGGM